MSAVRSHGGDDRRDSFDRLVRRHRPTIDAFVRARYPGLDSEEVGSVTFETAWRRFDDVFPHAERAWLIGIAVGVARNASRSARRRRAHANSYMLILPSAVVESDPGIDNVNDLDAVRRLFSKLKADDREILYLTVVLELTIAEAAVALDITAEAAKSRSARASQRLSKLLQEEQSDG